MPSFSLLLTCTAVLCAMLVPNLPAEAGNPPPPLACEVVVDGRAIQPEAPIGQLKMSLRADGRPLLAVTTNVQNESELYLLDCADGGCGSGAVRLLDQSNNFNDPPGLLLRADGRPAVAAPWQGGINYYDCSDAGCANRQVRALVPSGNFQGDEAPLVELDQGRVAMVYRAPPFSAQTNDVLAYVCNDGSCQSGSTQTVLDIPAEVSRSYVDLVASSDGQGGLLASWIHFTPSSGIAWELQRCPLGLCPSAVPAVVGGPTPVSAPDRVAMRVRGDGRPLLLDSQRGNRALIDCQDTNCSVRVQRPLPIEGDTEVGGLELDAQGHAVFFERPPGRLVFRVCADAACTKASASPVDVPTVRPQVWDLQRRANGELVLAYITSETRELRIATCSEAPFFADGFEPR